MMRIVKQQNQRKKKVYIFFRKEGFYPIELYSNKDAVRNAECNSGTLKVEDVNGNTIWKPKSQSHD